jgi:hypothetical protein
MDLHLANIWTCVGETFRATGADGEASEESQAAYWIESVIAASRSYLKTAGIDSIRFSKRETSALHQYPESVRLVFTASCNGELLVKRKVALDFARLIRNPQHEDALLLELPMMDFGDEEEEQELPMPRYFILSNPEPAKTPSLVVAQRPWLKRIEFPRHQTLQRAIEARYAWPFSEFFEFFTLGFDGLTTAINGERPEHSPTKRRMLAAGHQVTIAIKIKNADMDGLCERLESFDSL